MDASQWKLEGNSNSQVEERKVRPQEQQGGGPLNCPRCKSTNTKFCYYNNYSLTQPRYLCKSCRRYWTQGGSLRTVPVGGASRKNKRSISSSSITTQDTQHLNLSFQQQDYHQNHGFSQFLKLPKIENSPNNHLNPFNSISNPMFNVQEFKPYHENENGAKYGGFQVQEITLPFGVMMNQPQLSSTRGEGGQNMGGLAGYWNSSFLGGD